VKIPAAHQETVEQQLTNGKPIIELSLLDYAEFIKHKGDDFYFEIADKKFLLDMPMGANKHFTVEKGDTEFPDVVKWAFNFNAFRKYLKKHLGEKDFYEFLLYYLPEMKLPLVVLQKQGGEVREIICLKDYDFKKPPKEKKIKFDIVKLEKVALEPDIPVGWDYEQSLRRLQAIRSDVKKLQSEALGQLYIAWKALTLSPSEAAKYRFGHAEGQTWEGFCKALNVSQQTIYNWFNRAGLPYQAESKNPRAGRPKAQITRAIQTAINKFRGDKKDKKLFIDGLKLKTVDFDSKISSLDSEEVVIFSKSVTPKLCEVAPYLCILERGCIAYKGEYGEEFIKEFKNIGKVYSQC